MNGPELSEGDAGGIKLRRVGGNLERWDHDSQTFVPYVPGTYDSPTQQSDYAYEQAASPSHRYGGAAAYTDAIDAMEQFAPEPMRSPSSTVAPPRSTEHPMQIPHTRGGGDYAGSSTSQQGLAYRQQGGVRHSSRRSTPGAVRKQPSSLALARLTLPSQNIHHMKIQHNNAIGTAWTPETGYRFKHEFELDLHVNAMLSSSNSGPQTVGFSAEEIRSLALEELVAKNMHIDSDIIDNEAGMSIHDALVFSIRMVSVSNTLDVPVSVTFPQHQGMNTVQHNLSARRVYYVINPSSPTTIVNYQKDLSHELHSPTMNMLCPYAGHTDMPDAYRVQKKNTRCDVKYDSLLWAMAGADPKYHDEWVSMVAKRNNDDAYVHHISTDDVKRWLAMSLAYVYQKVRMRPLFPRQITSGLSVHNELPPDAQSLQVRFQPLVDDSTRLASKGGSGIVGVHIKVFCCIPVKVPRNMWQTMYAQSVEKGGAGFVERAAPAYVFLEETSGKNYLRSWNELSKDAVPEVALYGDFSNNQDL